MAKSRQQWAFDKMDSLSGSVSDLRARIDMEAFHYRIEPEAMLLRTLRTTSHALSMRLAALRERSAQLLTPAHNEKLATASQYIEHLDDSLMEADSIYKVVITLPPASYSSPDSGA